MNGRFPHVAWATGESLLKFNYLLISLLLKKQSLHLGIWGHLGSDPTSPVGLGPEPFSPSLASVCLSGSAALTQGWRL